MADNVDLEELVHLEQTFYDAGYADGFEHGRIHGLIEGRALGREKGFEIWEEIGFYQGFATTWRAICAQRGQGDQRALHHVDHLLDLIRQFPTINPSAATAHSPSLHAHDRPRHDHHPLSSGSEDTIDLSRLQRQIRSRYKALCASLGVRPTLRAGIGVAGSEDAGEGPGTADGGTTVHPHPRSHPQNTGGLKRGMWTLEGHVKRPTMQELSF